MTPEQVIQQLHLSTRRVIESGLWHAEQLQLAEKALTDLQKLRNEIAQLKQQVSNGNTNS